MSIELAEDLYATHSYQEVVEPGRLGGGYNRMAKSKIRKGATIEEEMKLVKMLTSFHKYGSLRLIVPDSEHEKWFKFIQVLANLREAEDNVD